MKKSEDKSIKAIKIINDITVNVPASMQLMTPYVLYEQNDWFEDEIKFLRNFITTGMKVIDIGANYGLYTLTIASIIGDRGKVWAFEPTKATSSYLRSSINDNGFNNIDLIQAGLSDKIKKAAFFTGPNSELNSLSKEYVSGNENEQVLLLTLDHCAKKYNWGEIDFIKLDAEGEESNILKKGKKFLSSTSPLIMFELKHGESVNLPLINRFNSIGYESYRLIPGLDVLVPFNSTEPFDAYLLNLFCCNNHKSSILETAQVIVKHSVQKDISANSKIVEEYLTGLPFSKSFNHHISDIDKISKEYLKILTLYALTKNDSKSAAEKVGYLMAAIESLRKMLDKGEQKIERLITFARISFDAGERFLGVQILRDIINRYHANLDFKVNEPVLPASSKYDSIDPKGNIKKWLFSSILEQYIIKHAYSSYFTRRESLPVFEILRRLGFMSDDMKKREALIKNVFPS